MEKETILITGGAGFIGSYLTKAICEYYPLNSIVVVDNMNSYYDVGIKNRRIDELIKKPNVRFVRCDISDKCAINEVFDEYKPSIVVNLAAQAGVRYSIDNPEAYINSNVLGFYNILEACRNAIQSGNPIKHLVYASSSSVYGDQDKFPLRESDNTDNPVSLYAATKKSNELFAAAYSKLYNIPCTGLRFFTVYGPDGRPDMAYYSFANKLLNGEKIKLYNYGNCCRDFTYIDDVIEVLIKVLQTPPSGELHRVYNVGGGNPVSLKKFVSVLFEHLAGVGVIRGDYNIDDCVELVEKQDGDVDMTYADTREIESMFGYKPNVGIDEGLAKFAKWFFFNYKSA